MSELARRGGSNLPEPAESGLARVTVIASKPLVAPGVAGAAGFLFGMDIVNGVVGHIPVAGHAITTFDHLPMVGTVAAVGAGFAAWKYVGKPIQKMAQKAVEKHSLS